MDVPGPRMCDPGCFGALCAALCIAGYGNRPTQQNRSKLELKKIVNLISELVSETAKKKNEINVNIFN